MTTNDLQLVLPFSESDADKQNYTASLLALCSANSMLSDKKQEEIQATLSEVFTETASQFTRRASSTISQKRANALMSSILYHSDVYLLSLNSTSRAVNALLNRPMREIITDGMSLVLKNCYQSQVIYKRAFDSKLKLPLYEYRYAIDKAFSEFSHGYSARFDARNCMASIDYPLLHHKAYEMVSEGVMFINEYYSSLYLENCFCNLFPLADIKRLLDGFGQIYHSKFSNLVFNICEVVLTNSLACAVVGKSPLSLCLTQADIETLYSRFSFLDIDSLTKEISIAFRSYYLVMKNPRLIQYLRKYIPTFASELYRHLSDKTLNSYLVIQQ